MEKPHLSACFFYLLFCNLAMWRIKEALTFGYSLTLQVQKQLQIKPKTRHIAKLLLPAVLIGCYVNPQRISIFSYMFRPYFRQNIRL